MTPPPKRTPAFLRKRKVTQAVLVLEAGLARPEPHLRSKTFHVVTMPAGVLDAETKVLFLCHRTLITRTPREFEYDVPVLEYSLIDCQVEWARTMGVWPYPRVFRRGVHPDTCAEPDSRQLHFPAQYLSRPQAND